MNKKTMILTFDIEEWFHILDINNNLITDWDKYECRIYENVEFILNELNKHGHKATFFCLGWVAERYPDIIREINRYGYEIGTHSYSHNIAYKMTPDQFREDLVKSKSIIENIISKPVRSFRIPGFSLTESNMWVFEILAESGITIDSSIFPAKREHGGYSKFVIDKPVCIKTRFGTIKEFPVNTVSLFGQNIAFSGGGYFRIFPYNLLKVLVEKSPYIMSYFHPRDFDPNQPVLRNMSIRRRFKSYVGLKSSVNKFKTILKDFEFVDIAEAEKLIKWNVNLLIIPDNPTDLKVAA